MLLSPRGSQVRITRRARSSSYLAVGEAVARGRETKVVFAGDTNGVMQGAAGTRSVRYSHAPTPLQPSWKHCIMSLLKTQVQQFNRNPCRILHRITCGILHRNPCVIMHRIPRGILDKSPCGMMHRNIQYAEYCTEIRALYCTKIRAEYCTEIPAEYWTNVRAECCTEIYGEYCTEILAEYGTEIHTKIGQKSLRNIAQTDIRVEYCT